MKRLLALLAAAVALAAGPGAARAAQCGQLPDAAPVFVDYAGGGVPWRDAVFGRTGVIGAVTSPALGTDLRSHGAQVVYFEIDLPRLAGTPNKPADPATITNLADDEYQRAVAATGCDQPWIVLNELLQPTVVPSATPGNQQYRANVLLLLQALAGRGAQPFLLLPSDPVATPGEAADWLTQAAQYAGLVREIYFNAPSIVQQGPILGPRRLRTRMRTSVGILTAAGIPAARIGIMLGFQSSGVFGRAGLQPLTSWLQFVAWNEGAARQVATELGVGSVWSWGWGTLSAAGADPDKQTAACVYLATRDPSLCAAPAVPDAQAGQIVLPASVECSFGGGKTIATASIDRIAALTRGDREAAKTALFGRLVQRARAPVSFAAVAQAQLDLIRLRFGGRRTRFLQALASRRLTLPLAQAIIADELSRKRIASLVGAARVDTWTVQQEEKLLDTAVCLADKLPQTGDVRLANLVRFLRIAPG